MPLPSLPDASFASNRWTQVAAPGGVIHSGERPLLALCLDNWYPVYAYLRQLGQAPEQAQEATRRFFGQLLEAEPAREALSRFGRFRQYLQAELQAFVARPVAPMPDGAPLPPIALEAMEARQRRERQRALSPERALQRGFALELIARSLDRLRGEAAEARRLDLFDALEPHLTREPDADEYEAIAARLRMRPVLARMALRRLRERFRELVDDALGDTVLDADELEAERGALQAALSGEPP